MIVPYREEVDASRTNSNKILEVRPCEHVSSNPQVGIKRLLQGS